MLLRHLRKESNKIKKNKPKFKKSHYIPGPKPLCCIKMENGVWGGSGKPSRGIRVIWEERLCTHCQMFVKHTGC